MPVQYLARLTDEHRTPQGNRHLGMVLAFVAGAVNAGGFLAIGLYTSHVTGLVSSAADMLVLGQWVVALGALLATACFVAGAACTALLVSHARRHWPRRPYGPTLLIEALLLLAFGVVGGAWMQHQWLSLSLTAALLCFIMGLQNALITKVSNAEIRTTHLTGLMTDIGIELGKLVYWNRTDLPQAPPVRANRRRLRTHLLLVSAFFLGALLGALGFKHVGFITTVPLATLLLVLAAANVVQGRRPATRA